MREKEFPESWTIHWFIFLDTLCLCLSFIHKFNLHNDPFQIHINKGFSVPNHSSLSLQLVFTEFGLLWTIQTVITQTYYYLSINCYWREYVGQFRCQAPQEISSRGYSTSKAERFNSLRCSIIYIYFASSFWQYSSRPRCWELYCKNELNWIE